MKNLIIIGASGFGREVLTWVQDNPANPWRVKGFLDSRGSLLDSLPRKAEDVKDAIDYPGETRAHFKRDLPILGDPASYVPQKDDVFLCALGDPAARRKYAQPILDKGGEFTRLVHLKAQLSVFVSMGRGSIVGPFAAVSPDVRIGEFVTINSYTGIAHDVSIGDWCEIDGHCLIAGRAKIGARARVHGGAIITPDAEIGEGAVIGAGSVVIGKVPAGVTVFGNPAKKFDWPKPAGKKA